MVAAMRLHRIKGWRRHAKLPGRPDFVFNAERVAVFIDGCFWHGCPVHFKEPATAAEFWREKIRRNRARDLRVRRELRRRGWHVVRIWEHGFRRGGRAGAAIALLKRHLAAARSAKPR